jgi:hypothetical protein
MNDGCAILRTGTERVVIRVRGDIAFTSNVNELGLLSKQVDDLAYKMGRTPNLERTSLYSERISSVTSHAKVSFSNQSRRNDALGIPTDRRFLNPAIPATSTEVSTTPLGCFPRRPNRYLR